MTFRLTITSFPREFFFQPFRMNSTYGRCAGDVWLLHRFSDWTKTMRKQELPFIQLDSSPKDTNSMHEMHRLYPGPMQVNMKPQLTHISHGFNFENILLSHQTMTPYGFKILADENVQNFCWKTLLLNSHFSLSFSRNSIPFIGQNAERAFPHLLSISPEWWRVVGNDDQLGFALSQRFQRLVVTQAIFAGFHNQSQTGIGAL